MGEIDEVCTMYLVKKKNNIFTGNFGANTIDHVSKKELYIILSTLEKNLNVESDSFNQ